MTAVRAISPLRRDDDEGTVTNVELFFDLVYVFAVTQLSHLLVEHPSVGGAIQAAVLLALVWQVWAYTTWMVNYLDPNRTAVRVALLAVMLGSLVLSAGLPGAFHGHAMLVAIAYVTVQLARVLFTVWALRGDDLQRTFVRILVWSIAGSVLVVLGAVQQVHLRETLWAVSVVLDLVGASVTFYVPGLGRSSTSEWTINGSHFAERCQAFVLIALGESIVVIGGLLKLDDTTWRDIGAFAAAFLGAVMLWWIYFDRSAGDSVREIEESADPGRLARSAFHYVHPLIVAGIIVSAAADEKLLHDPAGRTDASTAWFLLGGTGLFIAGHALFKLVVWRTVSWPRVIAVAVLAALGGLAPHLTALVLGVCTLAVVVAVAIGDRLVRPDRWVR